MTPQRSNHALENLQRDAETFFLKIMCANQEGTTCIFALVVFHDINDTNGEGDLKVEALQWASNPTQWNPKFGCWMGLRDGRAATPLTLVIGGNTWYFERGGWLF